MLNLCRKFIINYLIKKKFNKNQFISFTNIAPQIVTVTPICYRFSSQKKAFAATKKKKEILYAFTWKDRKNEFFKSFRQQFKIDDLEVFSVFHNSQFLKIVNKQFRILPFLFEENLLLEFRKEIDENESYQQLIQQWYQNPLDQRIKESKVFFSQGTHSSGDSINESLHQANNNDNYFSYIKPFFELYLDFLSEKYQQELNVSKSLSLTADLRAPHQMYPEARKLKRTVIYHHGPTNSGKTYAALQKLKVSSSGIYCAPLRMLAWEIHHKLEADNIPCNLVTGQEKIIRPEARFTSCTVEVASSQLMQGGCDFECAIIDEIQMIGDLERGAAWTNALLGLQAKTIHLCGDCRALNLVEKLCRLTKDQLQEQKYNRMSFLNLETKLFRLSHDLKRGDCIISFSIRDVHQLKKLVNKNLHAKKNVCAVVYGRLPPESRKNQAILFNDEDSKLKYLVATNAIGMGVNFRIKRIIFSTLRKKTSTGKIKDIEDHEILQIAGRAGRFQEDGSVCCMQRRDLQIVRKALMGVNDIYHKEIGEPKHKQSFPTVEEETGSLELANEEEKNYEDDDDLQGVQLVSIFPQIQEDQPKSDSPSTRQTNTLNRKFSEKETQIRQGGLFPSYKQLERFATELQKIDKGKSPLSQKFKKFVSIAQIEGIYFIQRYKDFCFMADLIEGLNMSLKDQYTFCSCPLNLNPKWKKALKCFIHFAKIFSQNSKIKLNSALQIFEKTPKQIVFNQQTLQEYEEMYHIVEIYMWLGQKYPTVFVDQEQSKKAKFYICGIINEILEKMA